jgi:hypothetical protein
MIKVLVQKSWNRRCVLLKGIRDYFMGLIIALDHVLALARGGAVASSWVKTSRA